MIIENLPLKKAVGPCPLDPLWIDTPMRHPPTATYFFQVVAGILFFLGVSAHAFLTMYNAVLRVKTIYYIFST